MTTPAQDSRPEGAQASMPMTVARITAVLMAVAVVSYLVWDAQASADQEQDWQRQQAAPAGTSDGTADDPVQTLLPSSKSRVVNDSGSFFNDGSDVTLSGSKSGVLPSSKFLVLPSSKSGPPLRNEDETPIVAPKPKPAQAVKPTQTGGGNKD